jgi:hypothetical protein
LPYPATGRVVLVVLASGGLSRAGAPGGKLAA